MNSSSQISDNSGALRVCVIIPTYNNAATLRDVISDVSAFSKDIIVVNDGSTDDTESILNSFDHIQLISFKKNVGKGWALRTAFEHALSKDYSFAITIDSDGQHFAKDLLVFFDKLQQTQDAIILGARNMDQASVPVGSSFGNKFSNFWFKVETGIDSPDTQTGYRLYPLQLLKGTHYFTKKFEFEIEVLVRAAWAGVKIESVPVSVFYAPIEVRVSHFRPRIDFLRISILNTILVIIAFLYIKPRNFFRSLSKKKLRQSLYEQLFESKQSDKTKAISVAFGVFMGIIPIWGVQLAAAIFLAILFRLNKALVIIAANISIPPMIPLIIYLSCTTGALWMGPKASNIIFDRNISVELIKSHLTQYIYGSITLAVVAAVVFGLVTYILLKSFKKKSLFRHRALWKQL